MPKTEPLIANGALIEQAEQSQRGGLLHLGSRPLSKVIADFRFHAYATFNNCLNPQPRL
jgi:hypothetical protein